MDLEVALGVDLFGDEALMQSLEVEEWLYGTGLPENAPVVASDTLDRARVEAEAFIKGENTAPELAKTPEGKERALAIYAKARPLYHQIAVDGIDKILGPAS
jgi:hypothetical protein